MESRRNEGFTNTNDMFASNSQQHFNAYDNLNLFQNPGTTNTNFNDASWGVNASDFPNPNTSRGQHPVPSWQQNANHLSATNQHAAFNNGQSPYGRPMNQSPAPYGQNNVNGVNTQQAYQYRQPQPQAFNNVPVRAFNSPAQNGATITPQALDRSGQPPNYGNLPYGNGAFPQNIGQAPGNRSIQAMSQARPIDQKALAATVPKGADSGMFSVISFDNLAQTTNSERMSSYVNVGKQALEWDCTRSAVPVHYPRKSRNDLRALAGNNPTVLSKLGKKSTKTKLNHAVNSGSVSSPRIKYEQDSSSSEESSEDDSDSDSSDDDESDSPLPAKRPEEPKAGVEYDTIKAVWRSKRKTLSSESIRKGLIDFWDLIKVIRDRWKADTAAVDEAKEKNRAGELPLLQSRVKDQRDMMETAWKAAFKHGHRAIVELLAENVSLLFLCYQFLLDRGVKAQEYNVGITRALLEAMSTFTTLSTDKLEKTHLDKVLKRYLKGGDARTQHWVRKIFANAETATKEAASKPKTEKPPAASGDVKPTVAVKKGGPEPVAGVKRPATTTASDGNAAKKILVGGTKVNGNTAAASKLNGVVKKNLATADAAKPNAVGAATATIKKSVVGKPSGLFSHLQSASKKPGTSIADKASTSSTKSATARSTGAPAQKPAFSFAETMANLTKPKEEKPAPKVEKEIPNETPEQRAKRIRKEQRRKLHVTFKNASELVEIRYFTHDPEEEVDQGSSQKRDFSDVGGEGRMFKQQAHKMDLDDEDEMAEEAENLKDHRPPSLIDFSVVGEEDRKRNYEPYGGGELKVQSNERAVREDYESKNLIVFYTEPSQIPPNPREPADPYNGDKGGAMKYFGPPEDKYAARARAKRAQYQATQQPYGYPMQHNQAAPTSAPDISSILASLQQAAPQQQPQYMQPQQPYMGMQAPQAPQVPPGNIDLAAILASLNPAGGAQQGGFGAGAAPMMGFAPQTQQAQMFGGGNSTDDGVKKHPQYKTKACRFYQSGECTRGDACTFLHE